MNARAEAERDAARAEVAVLREWHVQHGMPYGMANQPGGHLWLDAPGEKRCWCPHREDHHESPLLLHERAGKEAQPSTPLQTSDKLTSEEDSDEQT